MVYVPKVFTWRPQLVPKSQLFVAGGSSTAGGLTLSGVSSETLSIGGRSSLLMSFNTLKREANAAASWTYSRVRNGAVFCIPIRLGDQLVPAALLDPPTTDGIPWANAQPWATGENWEWNPTAPVTAASRGAVEVTVDLSDYGQVIEPGHVVGFSDGGYRFAHMVMDVEADGDDATLTLEPPLRRALTSESRLQFRPSITAMCVNPDAFAGAFEYGRYTTPGQGQFVEVLV